MVVFVGSVCFVVHRITHEDLLLFDLNILVLLCFLLFFSCIFIAFFEHDCNRNLSFVQLFFFNIKTKRNKYRGRKNAFGCNINWETHHVFAQYANYPPHNKQIKKPSSAQCPQIRAFSVHPMRSTWCLT